MFEVKSLDAFYGKSQALVDVSFQLSAGGFWPFWVKMEWEKRRY